MRKVSRTILVSTGLVVLGMIGLVNVHFTPFPVAEAAVSDWQKGVSMYPSWTGDFDTDSFRQSLKNAHDAGATNVALIVPEYQANDSSSDIYGGGDTPTDASLISAINYAHSLGMKVMLKPHLAPQTGDWRADINASNRDAWFANYGNLLNHLGDIGAQTGVEGMCIGTELINMATYTSNSDNTERWQSMIGTLRQHFSGFLTYSANWGGDDFTEEVPHIGFWPSLDFIGISAYYPLAQGQSNPSVDALTGSWNYWDTTKIAAIHNQFNKPILFTEIGYRSVDNAHNAPWDPTLGGGYNAGEQSNDFQALLTYWNNIPYMNGIYVWNWDSNPGAGGTGNTDFTPQNKPAQSLLSGWFGNPTPPSTPPTNNPGPTPTPTPSSPNPTPTPAPITPSSVSGNWTITGQAPSGLAAGQASNISAQVSISDHATNVIADLEIYDSSGHQVAQQFFAGQNITSSGSTFTIPWTPSGNGTYIFKVGIFNQDWTQMYIWNDSVTQLNVGVTPSPTPPSGGSGGSSGSPAPSGPVTMDIWWPTDGSWISGVQPFKGLVENMDLSQYKMYWKVDGGSDVEMSDNQTDYPHKEFDVDVGPWTWSGNGPYNVTFTAKDSSGTTIAQKSFNVNVAH